MVPPYFDFGGGDEYGRGTGGSGQRTSDEVALDTALDATVCEGGLSFIATTQVATEHGEQAIGTVKVGEQVWSYNPKTKKMELKPILHVWINHDHDLVDLTITKTTKQGKEMPSKSEVIHTNKKHPFLTMEKGFLPVGQMKLGMHVVEANGQVGVITGWKLVPGVMTMYNLEVAQDHTFVVGMGQWVVHNCDPTLRDGTQVDLTQYGLDHSFGRHASEWFDRDVTDEDRPAWENLIEQTTNSKKIFPWDLRGRPTTAVLARLQYYGEMRYFVAQFYKDSGELATAFRPTPAQLRAMLSLIKAGK